MGTLERLIDLACLAPSVGLSQPWRFVIVEDAARRAAVRENFAVCNAEALTDYGESRASHYARLKLAGLDEAPLHFAVFADRATMQGSGLGRRTMPEMAEYSAVAAVHTIWLAARAEGIGAGWVSMFDPQRLREICGMPEGSQPIAVLCVGQVEEFYSAPMLELERWDQRRPLGEIIFQDQWGVNPEESRRAD